MLILKDDGAKSIFIFLRIDNLWKLDKILPI